MKKDLLSGITFHGKSTVLAFFHVLLPTSASALLDQTSFPFSALTHESYRLSIGKIDSHVHQDFVAIHDNQPTALIKLKDKQINSFYKFISYKAREIQLSIPLHFKSLHTLKWRDTWIPSKRLIKSAFPRLHVIKNCGRPS